MVAGRQNHWLNYTYINSTLPLNFVVASASDAHRTRLDQLWRGDVQTKNKRFFVFFFRDTISNRRNTIAKMMKLLPLLAALLVVAEPIAASRLPSGRAFLPPKATTNVENDNLSSRKHRNVRSSVLDIPRGGVGPLPVEDTAKAASAFCK